MEIINPFAFKKGSSECVRSPKKTTIKPIFNLCLLGLLTQSLDPIFDANGFIISI